MMKPLTICDTPLHTFKKALIDLKQKKDNWSLSHLRIQEREGVQSPKVFRNVSRLYLQIIYTCKSLHLLQTTIHQIYAEQGKKDNLYYLIWFPLGLCNLYLGVINVSDTSVEAMDKLFIYFCL